MNDPIWRKVAELTQGYNPQFNAAAAYDVIAAAWLMGFDVVRQPPGSDLYNAAMQEIGMASRNMPFDGSAAAYSQANPKAAHE